LERVKRKAGSKKIQKTIAETKFQPGTINSKDRDLEGKRKGGRGEKGVALNVNPSETVFFFETGEEKKEIFRGGEGDPKRGTEGKKKFDKKKEKKGVKLSSEKGGGEDPERRPYFMNEKETLGVEKEGEVKGKGGSIPKVHKNKEVGLKGRTR